MAKRESFTSPRGVFKFCHINEPDRAGAERFNSALQYKVTLLLDKDDPKTVALIRKLDRKLKEAEETAQEKMDEASPKQKATWKRKGITAPDVQPYYADELDEDTGEPTGKIELRFKTHYQFEDKRTGKMKTNSILFRDARGTEIPTKKRPKVFSGTEGRVAFTTSPAFIADGAKCFLSLYFFEIKILELSTAGSGPNPFDEEDEDDAGGFSVDDLEDGDDDDGDDADGDLDDDDDDDADDDGDDDAGDGDLDDDIPF